MKIARFLFLMIVGVVLVPSATLSRQSNQSRGPTSPSRERLADDTAQVGERDRTGKFAEKHPKSPAAVTGSIAEDHPNEGHHQPRPRHQAHSANMPTASNLRTPGPGSAAEPTDRSKSFGVADRTATRRSGRVFPPTFAKAGQRFQRSRDPGARLTTSGGPAGSAQGTVAINGTNMKPKP